VTLADSNGNPVNNAGANGTVTLSLKTGTGTLGGTVIGTIAVGASSVTISGVTYTKAESGVEPREPLAWSNWTGSPPRAEP
jgi:hypothetical protein